MEGCLFCKIAKKEIPARLVYEDAHLFAFEDIAPQAPVHILICPRRHVSSLHVLSAEPASAGRDAKAQTSADASASVKAQANDNAILIGRAMLVAAQLAAERSITDGYRTVINNGAGAGQSVFHLHVHLLGGREFRWPPG